MVAKFDRRSALLVSEQTGFVAKQRRKPLVEKTQIAGPTCLATKHLVRTIRTDPAPSSGLRSKKNSGRCRSVFLDFYLYRTYQEPKRSHSCKEPFRATFSGHVRSPRRRNRRIRLWRSVCHCVESCLFRDGRQGERQTARRKPVLPPVVVLVQVSATLCGIQKALSGRRPPSCDSASSSTRLRVLRGPGMGTGTLLSMTKVLIAAVTGHL